MTKPRKKSQDEKEDRSSRSYDAGASLISADLPDEFSKLTQKQASFVIFYGLTRNGVEAARLAGYSGSYMTLAQQASQNLKNPQILQAFDTYMRPMYERQGVSVERTISHIADIAYAPWCDHLKIKEKKGKIVSVHMQMSAKVKALELLAKILRLTADKEVDIQQYIDSSQNIHVSAKTPAEARKALLDFLKRNPRH